MHRLRHARRRARGLRVDLAGDRRDDVKIPALDGSDPFAANEIIVLGLVLLYWTLAPAAPGAA
jgi:hypothetical protein